jgi:7,8-didemethyl-8-hydroxy-5-deazariboflavin synthase CofH subunit
MGILINNGKYALRQILDNALKGIELSETDAISLFDANGDDLTALLETADAVKRQRKGNEASFVITRNINFTNICNIGCGFCNFSKRKNEVGAELLSMSEIVARAREAKNRGATEVCIQGGLHPDIGGDHYRNILIAIKKEVPDIHIHAFSPFEIWYGSRKSRMSVEDFLTDLKEQGLGSIPGTAAEILDTEVRLRLTKNKLSAEEWVSIIRTAHKVGIPSTSTMMYGHVDSPRHWAAHIGLLRDIQKETGGFTEFVPLGFVHEDSPLYKSAPDVRPGPTELENLRLHAIARLMLAGQIDNIQVSWVKLGPQMAQRMLRAGANDLGGTLMNESISRAAGAKFGQEITPAEMVGIINSAGYEAVQRNTLYKTVARYDENTPADQSTLVARSAWQQELMENLLASPKDVAPKTTCRKTA